MLLFRFNAQYLFWFKVLMQYVQYLGLFSNWKASKFALNDDFVMCFYFDSMLNISSGSKFWCNIAFKNIALQKGPNLGIMILGYFSIFVPKSHPTGSSLALRLTIVGRLGVSFILLSFLLCFSHNKNYNQDCLTKDFSSLEFTIGELK